MRRPSIQATGIAINGASTVSTRSSSPSSRPSASRAARRPLNESGRRIRRVIRNNRESFYSYPIRVSSPASVVPTGSSTVSLYSSTVSAPTWNSTESSALGSRTASSSGLRAWSPHQHDDDHETPAHCRSHCVPIVGRSNLGQCRVGVGWGAIDFGPESGDVRQRKNIRCIRVRFRGACPSIQKKVSW